MKYAPIKLELWLTLVILIVSAFITWIIFTEIINYKHLNIILNILIIIVIYIPASLFMESLCNIFYERWKR
jgi:hypothetical protein